MLKLYQYYHIVYILYHLNHYQFYVSRKKHILEIHCVLFCQRQLYKFNIIFMFLFTIIINKFVIS